MDHAAHLRYTFVVIDFEALTPAGRPAVPIEVAALALISKGEEPVEVWRFQSLMKPPADVPVTDFDVRQTGITPAMLAGAAEPGDVMARLEAMLTAPPYRLVAHHAATETNLIAHQRPHCPALAAVPLLDTVRLARLAYPELTSHAVVRRRTAQPGPLSTHWCASTLFRTIPNAAMICSRKASSSSPVRQVGGAANDRRPSARRTSTSPATHCWTINPGSRGVPPLSSQAWQEPSVGCPAKGISPPGVKMRTR